jgi:chemotaxis protein methyltransferase CheR
VREFTFQEFARFFPKPEKYIFDYTINKHFSVEEISLSDLKRVVSAAKEAGGVDFSNYATASLRRRVLRLADTSRIRTTDELLMKIKNNNGFIKTFVNEVTVNTTEMFRDPLFWKVLNENVIPTLANKSLIKIWHAACSTGEEVYSMSILMREAGLFEQTRITATDINDQAMEIAGKGNYPLRNQKLNQVNYSNFKPSGQLSDYYEVLGNRVQFDLDLIKHVKFKSHDLVRDRVFSKFDLIICRNVLIYFNADLQERVIRIFNESMYKDSFLGIGIKESISWCKPARNFTPVSLEEKVFKKISY